MSLNGIPKGAIIQNILTDVGNCIIIFEVKTIDDEDLKIAYYCYGQCCAYAYIATANGSADIIGGKFIEFSIDPIPIESDDPNVFIEATAYRFKTNKGELYLDFRLEHNGYYSGSLKQFDDEEYLKRQRLIPLKDF